MTKIYLGDSLDVLKLQPENSVDLVITSPPYADQRKDTYGGIHHDKYVEWFLPISKELLRVLKPTGTFILNIKEKVVESERSTYVMELILAMRKQGWLWTEEFIWHKKNSFPGKWPNRFRDSWERLLQFNKAKHFNMYQDAVMVPMGDWAKTRLKKLSDKDKTRDDSKVGSGFGKNISNWLKREMAYPTNVIHLATECRNKNHSAAFPEGLPEWFMKLFTKPGDKVLDPFVGSGTTLEMALRMDRSAIGIDIVPEYYGSIVKLIDGHFKGNNAYQKITGEEKEKSASKILKPQIKKSAHNKIKKTIKHGEIKSRWDGIIRFTEYKEVEIHQKVKIVIPNLIELPKLSIKTRIEKTSFPGKETNRKKTIKPNTNIPKNKSQKLSIKA